MDRPHRVLAITARADIGGGPEHLFQLCRSLGDQARVTIACPPDAPYDARYRTLSNVEQVVEIPHRAFTWSALMRLRQICKDAQIDLIHSHGKGAGLYGRLLGMFTGTPVVHTFHGLHVGEYGIAKKSLYLGLETVLGWWTRAAIAVSDGEAAGLRAARILKPSKLNVIPNGVELGEASRPRSDLPPLRVLAVSRYDYQKNAKLCLDIAAEIKERGLPIEIRAIGTGEALEECQARVVEEALEGQITLAGPTNKPRDDMRWAHVFLSTSRWEGMPLAVLEAMSEGCVPVLTDVVGNRDVLSARLADGLFRSEDASDGADRLVALLQNPNALAALSIEARETVAAHFSVDEMARKTAEIYDAVLRSS